MTAATILIPTYDAPESLPAAVASALDQTVGDIEVLIVGDGVVGRHRGVVEACVGRDERVRFLDLPKGAQRGERNRHHGVHASASDAIVYLADDDLLLPRHVENMLQLLADSDLCQSFNAYVDRDDRLRLLPTDLSEARWRTWHLQDPPRNRVSITGTAHTRAAYDRLERGWDLAEPGVPTDLTLWRQFFVLDDIRGRTHPEVTTLQFPGFERSFMDEAAIAAQRERWTRFIARPDAHEALQSIARESARVELIEWSVLVHELADTRAAGDAEREEAARALQEATERAEHLASELEATHRTLSWRITAPLRAVRRRTRPDADPQR